MADILEIIEEMKLRKQILKMRRGFLKQGVFNFTFIALYDDVPYLFSYPEKVLVQYSMSDKAMKKFGLDKQNFSKVKTLPVIGYLVKGDKYPFDDQAGYFEGELAVIFENFEFESLADHLVQVADGP